MRSSPERPSTDNPPSGLPDVATLSWGTRVCQFYRTPEDLAATHVPYLAAGLANGERCLWITAPLSAEQARRLLRRSVPDADRLEAEGRIEIVDAEAAAAHGGSPSVGDVLERWAERERSALAAGFRGLRITGDMSWIDGGDRPGLHDRRGRVHEAFHRRRIVALCSYPLERCTTEDLLDLLRNHGSALVEHGGRWELTDRATQLLAALEERSARVSRSHAQSVAAPRLSDEPNARHAVQLIAKGSFPAAAVAGFLCDGLRAGEGAIVIARGEHLDELLRQCGRLGVDVEAARGEGLLLLREAEEARDLLMGPGWPRAEVFEELVGAPVARLAAGRSVRAYGEIVDVMWERGEAEAALALEDLWNGLLARFPVRLLCGYTLDAFDGSRDLRDFRAVCERHDDVAAAAGAARPASGDAGRLAAELQVRARQVEIEAERRREPESAEREARDELHLAHRQLEDLQRVTAMLSEALTVEDVGHVVTTEMASMLVADQAILVVPEEDGHTLRLLAHLGLPTEMPRQFATFPADAPLPAAECFRTARPVWVTSRAELYRRFSGVPALNLARSVASLPVTLAGRLLGVMVFAYVAERTFSVMQRAFMEDLARQAGFALERAQLYAAARRSEARLQEANRRKDEFLALLGHELRNPLAPILTAVQVMRLRGETGSVLEQAVIERQALHMARLVDDLLDVSRITQGKLELQRAPVELGPVVARAVEMAAPLIAQRGHRLQVEGGGDSLWVEADATRLAQVLANLLNNAAKYTDVGGEIRVRAERVAGDVVLSVRDNGVGLSAEALATVFEPFVQVARTVERAQGGLGLGLALVRSLVELHGGTVAAASAGLGRGSEFTVRLPALRRRRGARVGEATGATHPGRGSAGALRVLVVDDDADGADGLASVLRLTGHEATAAYDASTASAAAAAQPFDVVLLDIDLPGLDGYELAGRLRTERGCGGAAFLALSGFGGSRDFARSREAGFLAHLVKPVEPERLLALLDTLSRTGGNRAPSRGD